MSISQKFKADAHIHARRETEFKLQKDLSDINRHKNLALTAQWEHKTDKIIVKQVVKGRLEGMRVAYRANLETRRDRLAALLANEDRMYEHEFNEK